jgi:hypothetical protein
MEPHLDQQEEMFPGIDVNAESWRYEAIKPDPHITRPPDWFCPSESVVCKTFEIWVGGKILEVQGNPPILMICLRLDGTTCSPGECDPSCGDRYWAMAHFGGVLGKKDLFRILADPDPLNPVDPLYGIADYQQAEQLFQQIEELEARQKSC